MPIDTASPLDEADGLIVKTAQTDIGLIGLPQDAGTGSISGTVELPASGAGVLVVAETNAGSGGAKAFSAIANREGEYKSFNVPAADYDIGAYAKGVNYSPANVGVTEGAESVVNLVQSTELPGKVSGTIQIVNAPGGALSTVILVVESTFDRVFARGMTVPGLRAPEPGVAANIESDYLIEGVPVGRYVVLAAFENDNLVRDPDISIGGTSILHIEVFADSTTVVDGFKVTEALAIASPGASGPEAVSGSPTFRWADDSSEDEYLVEVLDSFGEIIWDETMGKVNGGEASMAYAGPALMKGMYYQFRVTSKKDGVPLSRTEDLRGVFFTE